MESNLLGGAQKITWKSCVLILKNYSDYNVNLEAKEKVNKAIESLENNNYITSSKLKLSEDYESKKIHLRPNL